MAAAAAADPGARMAVALSGAPALGSQPGATPLDSVPLPPLREDLKLLPGPASGDGSPTWMLHDPARHRFLRIGWLEFEILSRWGIGRSGDVAEAVSAETTIRARPEDVLEVLRFAHQAGLVAPRGDGGIA